MNVFGKAETLLNWTGNGDGIKAGSVSIWCVYTGQREDEVQGWGWLDMVYPDERERVRQIWTRAAQTKQFFTDAYRICRHDGAYQLLKVLAIPLVNDDLSLREWAVLYTEDKEEERALLLAREQAAHLEAIERTQQLEAIFESMTDGVFVYDGDGNIIRSNTAGHKLLHLDADAEYMDLPMVPRLTARNIRDEYGQPLPMEQWPMQRIIRGESLQGEQSVDILMRLQDGQDVMFNESGAPVRDAQNAIIGGVIVFRDVTKRRQVAFQVKKAFEMLLALAEELVSIQPYQDKDALPEEERTSSQMIRAVGRRLAELTVHILECRFVGITLLEPGNESARLRPLAVAGLSPEDMQLSRQEVFSSSLFDYLDEANIERLRANEVVIYDLTQRPFVRRSSYGIRRLLEAPMIMGGQLVGVLGVEKKAIDQEYTEEEVALIKAVAKLIQLVIERERLQQEGMEAQANELALRETNRRFDEFLSIASHELRTPLTTIKGNIQLALRRLLALERQKLDEGGVLSREIERIRAPLLYAEHRVAVQNRMIGDLLDVSRIQANKLELRMNPCNLVEIIHEAVEDEKYALPDRNILLELPEEEVLSVVADADRIGQVVHNYLSNALKYSPFERPVKVSLKRVGQVVRVAVQDEGPGLLPEDQKHVWERFYRVKGIEVQSGSGSGLGLGLHICRTIIEHHRGEFGLESVPGVGSTFWFSLSLAQPPQLSDMLEEVSPALVSKEDENPLNGA